MDVSLGSGAAHVGALPVGERMNYAQYRQVGDGTSVRIAGRFFVKGLLTTVDGGVIVVDFGGALETPQDASFVEVLGTKAPGAELHAVGLVKFAPGQVDEALWNEAVKLAQLPQLRHLFAPIGGEARAAASDDGAPRGAGLAETQPLTSETQPLTEDQLRANAALLCPPTQLEFE
ncbi:unnamed protein product [Prorocentrum cordatum]|uniref:Uncharacterized protein n=1 Tax=Prorocentrum cordatum TaxID=2364126 RepID=A0ABN9RKD2_9DINO|nr:unnamed protein product [Polarella glacialis]CAK0815566.1 unnamed protein product [Polarella glacialis]CAK0818678.1 unnamed protein product [Polarella glacialis]CAK0831813.1 unnamed protein product [Polarella glacialis]CAK0841095.1 unnamed protein product [Polarella glacialis]